VLGRAELRQLRQRILVHYDLRPLTFVDTEHYIQHRLTLAGGHGRPTFTTWAMRAIHRASGGIPRLVNSLCDKAMLLRVHPGVRRRHPIGTPVVAIKEFQK